MLTLHTIPLNTPFRIVSVTGDCATAQRVRELGFIPGAACTVVRRAPFGGPMEVALQRRTVGLRLTEHLEIAIEPILAESPSITLFEIEHAMPVASVSDESVAA